MFFVNLKAHYEELSVYEQEVIDYLMKQDNIEAQTLKSIGTALHLSASTIVRAGKKLGYATFNELKYDLPVVRSPIRSPIIWKPVILT